MALTREKANKLILRKLERYLEISHGMRFKQMLINLDIMEDDKKKTAYHEESKDTYMKLTTKVL